MERNILEREVAILKYDTENTCTHLGIIIQIQNSSTSCREQPCFWKQGVEIVHFNKKKRAHTDTTGKFFVDRRTKNGNQLNDKKTFFL